jgi:hypothetical protein
MGADDGWSGSDDAYLRDAINKAQATKLGNPGYVLAGMNAAYVLIFNAGQHDEGVYTLQGRASSTHSYVLAFEATDDADRFAQLLQAEGFDLATPLCWESEQLINFCTAGDFEVSLVPGGGLITPPAKNEYDHDAFEQLMNGGEASEASGGGGTESHSPVDPTQFADERARFERLFNQD